MAPIVGKMPWVKVGRLCLLVHFFCTPVYSAQGTVGASNGGVRKSKFGPPVDQAIPPPSMLTSQVVSWSSYRLETLVPAPLLLQSVSHLSLLPPSLQPTLVGGAPPAPGQHQVQWGD